MQWSKVLVVASSVLVTLLVVEIFGQSSVQEMHPPRYQISAWGSSKSDHGAYVIDTETGTLWGVDQQRAYLLGNVPAK